MDFNILYSMFRPDGGGFYVGYRSEGTLAYGTMLSVLLTKRAFPGYRVIAYADKWCKDFINRYRIPFDAVIDVSEALVGLDYNAWSLNKLYTMKIQTKPFLHVDNDVFFLKPIENFEQRFANCDLFCQNVEYLRTEQFYVDAIRKYRATGHVSKYPWFRSITKSIWPPNVGILYMSRLEHLDQFYNNALEILDLFNERYPNYKNEGCLPVFFEQYALGKLASHYNYKVDTYLNVHWDLSRDAHEKGYSHLISHTKRSDHWENRVKIRLKEEFPAEFYCIEDLVSTFKTLDDAAIGA